MSNLADGYLAVLDALARGIEPDPDMWVDEWAEAYMVIPKGSEPGPYRNHRTPYAREVMRCLSPAHPCKRVVVRAAEPLDWSATAESIWRRTQGLRGTLGTFMDQGDSGQPVERTLNQRTPLQQGKRLGNSGTQPGAGSRGYDNGNRAGHGVLAQDAAASTSSRMISALASSVFSARASSPTRICRALASMRFSPADSPRS